MVLYVSPNGKDWKVHFEKESKGKIFADKHDAIKEARSMVRNAPKGAIKQIKVQLSSGMFQHEWTYGVDPYPPVG